MRIFGLMKAGVVGLTLCLAMGCRANAQQADLSFRRSFPFGSEVLMTHSFPPGAFWVYEYDKLNDDTTRAHQAALYAIWVYYLGLHPGSVDGYEGLPGLPPMRTKEVIALGGEEDFYTHSTLLQETDFDDMFVYGLPKMGKYDAYYVAENKGEWGCDTFMVRNAEGDCCVRRKFACNADGILILYDPGTLHAKLLHLYYLHLGSAMAYRFFYIGEDWRIHVFEGVGDDNLDMSRQNSASFSLVERYEVSIIDKGDIEVAEKNTAD